MRKNVIRCNVCFQSRCSNSFYGSPYQLRCLFFFSNCFTGSLHFPNQENIFLHIKVLLQIVESGHLIYMPDNLFPNQTGGEIRQLFFGCILLKFHPLECSRFLCFSDNNSSILLAYPINFDPTEYPPRNKIYSSGDNNVVRFAGAPFA